MTNNADVHRAKWLCKSQQLRPKYTDFFLLTASNIIT